MRNVFLWGWGGLPIEYRSVIVPTFLRQVFVDGRMIVEDNQSAESRADGLGLVEGHRRRIELKESAADVDPTCHLILSIVIMIIYNNL